MIKRQRVKPSEYIINNGICVIIIYGMKDVEKGRVLIDTKNIERCKQHKWFIKHRNGTPQVAMARINKKLIRMHHFLFGKPPEGLEYDHKNRNPLNNCEDNLRLCTFEQNQWNQSKKKTNTSGYKGVSKQQNGFCARITVKGKEIYLGYFSNKEKAAKVYNNAVNFYRDEYAYLNPTCMEGA